MFPGTLDGQCQCECSRWDGHETWSCLAANSTTVTVTCWGWELGIIQVLGCSSPGTFFPENIIWSPLSQLMNVYSRFMTFFFFLEGVTVPTCFKRSCWSLNVNLGERGSDLRTALHLSSLWGSQTSVSWSWDCKAKRCWRVQDGPTAQISQPIY